MSGRRTGARPQRPTLSAISVPAATIRGVGWMAGANWVQLALSLTTFALITRRLTPTDVGLYGGAALVVGFGSTLAGGPFTESLEQRDTLDANHVTATFWASLGVSLALGAGIAFGAGAISAAVGAPHGALLLRLLALGLPLSAAAGAPGALLIRELRFADASRLGAFTGVVSSLAGIVAMASGAGLWSLVIVDLLGKVCWLTGVYRLSGFRPGWPRRMGVLRDLMRFNLHTLATYLLGYADRNAPRLLIAAILGARALGYFALAARALDLLSQLVLSPLGAVTMTSVARVQGDRAALQALVRKLYEVSTLFGYPAFLGAAAMAPTLTGLMGRQWAPVILTTQILLLVGLRTSTGAFNMAVLRGVGRSGAPLILLGSGLVLQLVLVPLGSLYGVAGVATAVLVRTMAMWPVGCWLVREATGLGVREQLRIGWKSLLAAVVMSAAVSGVRVILKDDPAPAQFFACAATGLIVYVGVLTAISVAARVALADVFRACLRKSDTHAKGEWKARFRLS